MNWQPVYTTLAATAQLSGISDPNAIVWGQQGAAGAWIIGSGSGAKLVMSIRQATSLGQDYEEKAPPVGAANQVTTVVGQRQFIWTIRADAQTGDPARFALAYLENLRSRLGRSTTQEIFRTCGLSGIAVVEIHPTAETSYIDRDSGRGIVRYTMDVLMAAAENDADTSPTAGQYIDHVVVTSNRLENADGTDAAQQINETIDGP